MADESTSCLVVNARGELLLLFCQFKVMALRDVHTLHQGDIAWVSSVGCSSKGKLVFKIDDALYFHHHFAILV